MKYDDASWHYSGDFPKNQPVENAGTHISLFLRWCFKKGWAGALHMQETPQAVEDVINGKLSATQFLFKYCDGKLTNEDFNEMGNAFAARYYATEGLYLDDYAKTFQEQMYVAPEAAHDFEKFSSMLDERLRTGILLKADRRLPPGAYTHTRAPKDGR